jgi:hypothetical protein
MVRQVKSPEAVCVHREEGYSGLVMIATSWLRIVLLLLVLSCNGMVCPKGWAQTMTPTSHPVGCELLLDGGFEGGSSGSAWIAQTTGPNIIQRDQILARSGEYVAIFGQSFEIGRRMSLEQELILPQGSAYLQYYLRMVEASTDTLDYMTVSVDGTLLASYSIADQTTFLSYRPVGHDVSEFADGLSHTLRFECRVTGSGQFITTFALDDVTLNKCFTPEPTPTATRTETWTASPTVTETPAISPTPTETSGTSDPRDLFVYSVNWSEAGYTQSNLLQFLNNLAE